MSYIVKPNREIDEVTEMSLQADLIRLDIEGIRMIKDDVWYLLEDNSNISTVMELYPEYDWIYVKTYSALINSENAHLINRYTRL